MSHRDVACDAIVAKKFGEVSEWSKEHAWKVCKSKGFEGSNPSLTAKYKKPRSGAFFLAVREG